MENNVIIIGLTPQGLSVLRVLSRAGVDVVAFYMNKKNVGVHSKYGTKILFNDIHDLKNKILGTCIATKCPLSINEKSKYAIKNITIYKYITIYYCRTNKN